MMAASIRLRGAMPFDMIVAGLGARLLSARTFELVLAPALADYQIESAERRSGEWARRSAVLLALGGGLRMEVARHAGSFFTLALLPLCYNLVLLTIFSDFFDMTTGVRFIGALILVFSIGPVMMCFLPSPIARQLE